jgi:Co/Zn/Cd efflux system component
VVGEDVVVAYHYAASLAHRTDHVFGARRLDVAHAVFAHLVLLRIVFYLWWGQPRQLSSHTTRRDGDIAYLSMVGVVRAIAVNRRRIDCCRIWAWGWDEVVRRIRRP